MYGIPTGAREFKYLTSKIKDRIKYPEIDEEEFEYLLEKASVGYGGPLPHRTKSICPESRELVPAIIWEKDGKVWITKSCHEGLITELYYEDLKTFERFRRWSFKGNVLKTYHIDSSGTKCPFECGLCKRHKSHTCLLNIVVTNRCNLSCWYCLPGDEEIFVKKNGDVMTLKFKDLEYNFNRSVCIGGISGSYTHVRDLEVLSFNFKGWAEVGKVFKRKYRGKIVKIETDGGRVLRVTPEHGIFVYRDGCIFKKDARDLRVGDSLLVLDGGIDDVSDIEFEDFEGNVYDLEVKNDFHSFFASEILVSNCFFYAKEGQPIYEPTLEQIRMMLRKGKESYCNAVQLSLDYDERIIVMDKNGYIYPVKIGEFVEKFMKDPDLKLHPIPHERKRIEGFKILSIDGLRPSFKEIYEVIRHENNDDIIEVELDNGWKVRVSRSHSVFIFDGEIKVKRAEDLKIGDKMVCALRLPKGKVIYEISGLKVTKELMRLFAYYLGRGNDGLISFKDGEDEILKDCVECIKSVFRVDPKVERRDGHVYVHVELNEEFFKSVFNVEDDMKMEFLRAYFRCNGRLDEDVLRDLIPLYLQLGCEVERGGKERKEGDGVITLKTNRSVGFFKVKSLRKVKPRGKYLYDISVSNQAFFSGLGLILVHNTGGEPTLREDLVEIVRIAREEGYDHIQLNTDGIRLAFDKKFVEDVKGVNTIYLSFDGITPLTNWKNHWEIPLIFKNLREVKGPGIVLVPTLIRNINDSELGEIINFGLNNIDIVRGVNFQPISMVGRVPKEERAMFRITIPRALKLIEEQTNGAIAIEDWYPVPVAGHIAKFFEVFLGKHYYMTSHFACGCATYVFLDGEKVIPITRFIDVDGFVEYLVEKATDLEGKKMGKLAKIRVSADLILNFIMKFYDESKAPKSLKVLNLLKNAFLHGNYDALGEFHKSSLFLGMMHFQDEYNYDVERTERCVIHYGMPDGRVVPFCAFNVIPEFYRDEVQLKFSYGWEEWKRLHPNWRYRKDKYVRKKEFVEKMMRSEIYKRTYNVKNYFQL